MTSIPFLLVTTGAVLAACGQVFLKLGASGAQNLGDFLNGRMLLGFLLYGIGSILWVVALARLPLAKVYPFTILTFVLVYVASSTLLGEQITAQLVLGAGLVFAGLLVIVLA